MLMLQLHRLTPRPVKLSIALLEVKCAMQRLIKIVRSVDKVSKVLVCWKSVAPWEEEAAGVGISLWPERVKRWNGEVGGGTMMKTMVVRNELYTSAKSKAMAATDTIRPSRPSLRQSHHVISYTPPDLIPGEAAELTFVVSLLHLTCSVFVWCGQSEYGIDQMLAGSNTVEAAAADKNAVEAAAMEQEALASLSEEDRRQLQVEREADAQLEQAMREAGRSGDGDGDGASLEAIRVAPKGVLARHWGMAMQRRSGKVSDGGESGRY